MKFIDDWLDRPVVGTPGERFERFVFHTAFLVFVAVSVALAFTV